MPSREQLSILVRNPRRLPGWSLPASRIAIGAGYKPSMALLPDGSLVMTTLHMKQGLPEGGRDAIPADAWWELDESLPTGRCREYNKLWRSSDGGESWIDNGEIADMIGREQWLTCTGDGTLFATAHLLTNDVNNPDGICTGWLHRSTDGGKTWERTRALIEGELRCGVPVATGSNISRNVVELADGTLLLGVGIGRSSAAEYLWRSSDGGKTWDNTQRVHITGYYDNFDAFFAEDFTYLNDAGELLHWVRVGHPSPMTPMADGRVTPTGNDHCDRTMWTRSTDGGRTWSQVTDFSDYGQMYPRALKLKDGRLLLTLTQRGMDPPFGLRAVISYDDGDSWNLNEDHLIIEAFTPFGETSGGGFGNTVQLPDGSLATCYSWNAGANRYTTEVVRWSLP